MDAVQDAAVQNSVEQQRQQLIAEIQMLPADLLQEVAEKIALLRQKETVLDATQPSEQIASSSSTTDAPTPYELLKASGFIGCGEGPPDLAANHKAYLEKYLTQKYDHH